MQVLKICWGCQINLLPTKVREKNLVVLVVSKYAAICPFLLCVTTIRMS